MKRAIGYLRVSGLGQVDKDGEQRQLDSITAFCAQHELNLTRSAFEKGVSGTVEGLDRPAFREALDSITTQDGSDRACIVVERMDRLARDLMVQELLLRECRERGIEVYSADQPFLDQASNCGDPSRKLFRQIMGALAEWEKSALVLKLRKARDRKRAETGRCEGVKPYHETPEGQDVIKFISECRAANNQSLRQTVEALNNSGRKTRSGKAWTKRAVLHVWQKSKGHRQMRGGLRQEPTDAVEVATQQHKEACELRLARIQNGAEPSHKNGHSVELMPLVGGGLQFVSSSGRRSPKFRGQATATSWRSAHPQWD